MASSKHITTPLSPLMLGSRGLSLFVPTKTRPPAITGPPKALPPRTGLPFHVFFLVPFDAPRIRNVLFDRIGHVARDRAAEHRAVVGGRGRQGRRREAAPQPGSASDATTIPILRKKHGRQRMSSGKLLESAASGGERRAPHVATGSAPAGSRRPLARMFTSLSAHSLHGSRS